MGLFAITVVILDFVVIVVVVIVVVIVVDIDIDIDIILVIVGLIPSEKVVKQNLDCSEEGMIRCSGLSLQLSKYWIDNADKAVDRVEQEIIDRIISSLVTESPETSLALFLSISEQIHPSSLSILELVHSLFCSQHSNIGSKC